MASSPSPEGRAHLRLTAGSPLAEVFLVDHDFALVDRGIGGLDCTVEPGVYKVKAKLGDAVAEQLVVLDGEHDIDLSPHLDLGSPAPLEGLTRTAAPEMDAARIQSAQVHDRQGQGARVFLMARAWSGDGPPATPPKLSLHRPDGTLLAEPSASEADGRALVMNVEVDPGAYFLRWVDESGIPSEQCVHTVAGWQTQLFVLEDSDEELELGRTRVSVHMGRNGFDPTETQLGLVEQARTALADERSVSAGFLNEALPEKFENPMLGLYGAHLMLIARDAQREAEEERSSQRRSADHTYAPVSFEQPRYDTVVQALRDLLGACHPDVVALSTQVTEATLDGVDPVEAPPMLWRSWVLLIEASNAQPALVPVSTWRRTRRLLPLRPFLLWAHSEDDGDSDDWTRGVAEALATAKREPRQQPGGVGPMASLMSAGAAEASQAGERGVAASDDTRRRVSRELLAPRSAIDEIAAPGES